MPWCDVCDRFLSPSTVLADGTCPTCGRAVDPGGAHEPREAGGEAGEAGEAGASTDDEESLGPVPWHLKALLGALALYLGWRAWQGIEWVAHQL